MAPIPPEVFRQGTLETVVRWAWANGTDISDIVVQDEFTHDVVVPWANGWLVYDTT